MVVKWRHILNTKGRLNDAGDRRPNTRQPKAPPLGRTRDPEMVQFHLRVLPIARDPRIKIH